VFIVTAVWTRDLSYRQSVLLHNFWIDLKYSLVVFQMTYATSFMYLESVWFQTIIILHNVLLLICSISYLLLLWIYLLTPRCRVLLEQLTGLQLVKKFPAFHGTRRFITTLTSVRHLSLSWASPVQSIYPHPTSWKSILILSTHLRLGLPSGPFPSSFPTKTHK